MPINFYPRLTLTGGVAGSLDNLDGTDLQDLDISLVGPADAVRHYILDADSGAAESIPDIIEPDTNAGTKRWILLPADINAGDIATGVTINMTDAGGYYAGTEVETILQEVGQELLVHNLAGFEKANMDDVAISTDSGTPPTITATFTGTVYWWSDGVRYSDSGTDALQISDVNGEHWLYYDGATLTEIVNPTHAQIDAVIEDKCLVAMVYWNTNSNEAPILASEVHGSEMSGATHHWIHDTQGAKWEEGGTISEYLLDTSSDAAISFDLTDIEFYDDDIRHDIEDGVAANAYEQVLTGDAEIPVLYRDATNQTWAEQAASTLPYMVGGTPRVQYMDADNDFALTEVGNNQFCNYWLVACNDQQYPVKMIPGTAVYVNQPDAANNATDEVANLGGLPGSEFIILYRLLMQDGSGGTTNAKIIDITDYRAQSIKGVTAGAATDHGALTGLGDDDHAHYILVDGTRAFTGGVTGTTFDASTDFTVGGTVISDATITDDGTLVLDGAVQGVQLKHAGSTTVKTWSNGLIAYNATGTTYYFHLYMDGTNGGHTSLHTYHNGGTLILKARDDAAADKTLFIGDPGGAVTLYYAGVSKLETVAGGAKTTGDHEATTSFTVGNLVITENTLTTTDDQLFLRTDGAYAQVVIGEEDVSYGSLRLSGGATGQTIGGVADFYLAADYDATIDYYRMLVIQDDWHIGPDTNTDALMYSGGNNRWEFDADVFLKEGNHLVLDTFQATDVGSGIIIEDDVDSNSIGIGGLLFRNTDGDWDQADADDTSGTKQLGIALEASTGTKKILLQGFFTDTGWNWTAVGSPVFLSNTSGSFTQTKPTGTGDVVRACGYAASADTIYFNPSADYLTVA